MGFICCVIAYIPRVISDAQLYLPVTLLFFQWQPFSLTRPNELAVLQRRSHRCGWGQGHVKILFMASALSPPCSAPWPFWRLSLWFRWGGESFCLMLFLSFLKYGSAWLTAAEAGSLFPCFGGEHRLQKGSYRVWLGEAGMALGKFGP